MRLINNVQKEYLYKPVIYMIKNTCNNKVYIGLTVSLRTRIKTHLYNFNNKIKDYPLYRAFSKYGLQNFELTILESFDKNDPTLSQKLDTQEIYYILKFNSYVPNGYNQTLGGDGGITGYKFTNEQKEYLSNRIKQIQQDGRFKVYVYNVNNDEISEYNSLEHLSDFYHLNKKLSTSCIRNLITHNFLIVARSKEQLQEKVSKWKSSDWRNGTAKQIPEELELFYLNHTKFETAEHFNISFKTLYKWLKKLLVKKIKPVDNLQILEYYLYNKNKSETARHFNIDRHRVSRILKNMGVV